MPKSARIRAAQQARQLAAVERDGDPLIRSFTKDFERRALAAVRSGGKVQLAQTEIDKIIDEIAELQGLAFVKRYKQIKGQLDINLSFSRDVARLARGLDLDLDGIWKKFRANAAKRVRASVADLSQRLNKAIGLISARQQTTQAATRQLRRQFPDLLSHTAETLVRTHSQLAFGAASWQLDQDDPEGLIWGYQYFTVGDDRVRPEHAVFDGMIRQKDDPIWDTIWPPNGWNCRCSVVPLVEPERQTPIPRGAGPDPGFEFNPGKLLAA